MFILFTVEWAEVRAVNTFTKLSIVATNFKPQDLLDGLVNLTVHVNMVGLGS